MAGSKWAKGQDGPRVKMDYCCLPPERVELTVNNKKETNSRVKIGQESRGAAVVRCPVPQRVELTVNNRKETNGRVKMGQEGPGGKMGYCCLPPERVELTVNRKWQGQNRPRRAVAEIGH